MTRNVEVFISYCRKDERYREQLGAHLASLRNGGLITDWHDRMIPPGNQWSDEIDQHIESAQLILLLVSADFIASRYCFEIEVQRALHRHKAGNARVIPIILRPCDWETTPFAHLQALPSGQKPITKFGNRDEAWLNVVKGIRRVIQDRAASDTTGAGIDNDGAIAPDWRQKLNRTDQTGTARYLIDEMLKYGQPRCICFCWYGGKRDGVGVFHDRL